jgi:methyl-accepting chemotaxis protein
MTQYQILWDPYVAMEHESSERKSIIKAQSQLNQAVQATKDLRQLMDSRDSEGLARYAQHKMYPAIDPFTASVSELIELNLKEAETTFQATKQQILLLGAVLAIINAIMLIGSSVASYFIVKRLTSTVSHIASITDRVTESKNLMWRTQVQGTDELATIGNAFDGLLTGVDALVSDAKQSTLLLDTQAKEVASTASAISQGSINQSEATTAMASTLEEIAVSIAHLSDSAQHVQTQAEQANHLSKDSKKAVGIVLAEISAISDAVRKTESQVNVLAQQSADISNIVKLIKEVADQTNLLALNAAIEAARAGEAGRGFAVVADEVRKLAERTASATKEIDTLTTHIIQSTSNVSATMQQSVQHVKAGEELIETTTQAIDKIEQAINIVNTAATEMASSLQEQQTASNDIAQQVETIAQLSQQNATNSQQAYQIAEQLSTEVSILSTQLQAYTATEHIPT